MPEAVSHSHRPGKHRSRRHALEHHENCLLADLLVPDSLSAPHKTHLLFEERTDASLNVWTCKISWAS